MNKDCNTKKTIVQCHSFNEAKSLVKTKSIFKYISASHFAQVWNSTETFMELTFSLMIV